MLLRLREPAVHAANGTTSNHDRDTLQQEFSDLVDEVDRLTLNQITGATRRG